VLRRTPPAAALFPYTTLFRSTALDAIGKDLGPSRWDVGDVRRRVDAQRSKVRVASEQLTADRVVDVVACLASAHARVTVDAGAPDRKSTRLNSSHEWISYAVF